MLQVCLHGRGGQGVVTASEMLAQSAFSEGHQVQAFPSFGSERMGAPVIAFVRISDTPITTHEPILTPDAVVVQDATLMDTLDVFAGLAPDGWAVVNTLASATEVRAAHAGAPAENHIAAIPADAIVRLYLGANKPSAAMLGAFAALTGSVSLDSAVASINKRFSGRVAAGNVSAARIAYAWVERARTGGGDVSGGGDGGAGSAGDAGAGDSATAGSVTEAVVALGQELGIDDPRIRKQPAPDQPARNQPAQNQPAQIQSTQNQPGQGGAA
ncbi:MAG: 2-oxoacid:acceptor oxidoreductase family protein [Cellulomonadaceae bacterium]|jgi:pyruvate ferredoxin oxidoreductase gamma subunit|nr:2-oxoacid:acceptor oxidoreductase family protein [Cellulomonadaceae bacterium]